MYGGILQSVRRLFLYRQLDRPIVTGFQAALSRNRAATDWLWQACLVHCSRPKPTRAL